MRFDPIHTERLILRRSEMGDVEAAYQRRRLPEVARYQDWELPYTRERAEERMAELVEMEGPVDGAGWSLTVIAAAKPEQIMGDLYVGIKWGGRSAEIGYTFHPDFWGRGYATEAVRAIVEWLFQGFGVNRIEASLHPDNHPSARVLEACGMLFEGHSRQSHWRGDENSDARFYGMTRSDWEIWRDRPRHRPELVELIPITADNSRAVGALTTHKSQERFVSTMLGNFRDALLPPSNDGSPLVPWYRAIVADGELAGFIMASEATEAHPNPHLWRLLIDRMHQRRGVGSAALDLFEDWCREQGASAVDVSWVEGPGSPAPMYRARGYEPSGRIEYGETHAVKQLT